MKTLWEYYVGHGPRLLAVARAAVEHLEALDEYDHTDDGDFVHERARITVTEEALRMAVRGEEVPGE